MKTFLFCLVILFFFSVSFEGGNNNVSFAASSAAGINSLGQPSFSCGSSARPSPPSDTSPPDTGISIGPSGFPGQADATFEFLCNEGGCSYECQLNSGGWGPCSSPRIYSGLISGVQLFEVKAWDSSGNVDPTPALFQWMISLWMEMGTGSASGGGISNNSNNSFSPSVFIGTDGNPIISWDDPSGGNTDVYIRRWDGSAWVEMGAGSASGGGISNNSGKSYGPFGVIGSDGNPIISWFDNSGGDYEIYVRRWNGSGWVEMGAGSASGGGISNNSAPSYCPAINIGSNGYPIIAWDDSSGGNQEIYVRRWDGSSWVEMGTGSASGGGISNNSGASEYAAVLLGTDGYPIIAWDDNSGGDQEIYIRKWNGSSWVEMGAGSASGGGISNNSGNSYFPSLIAGSDGNPIAVWHDDSGGDQEIYVRKWNSSLWVEMGAGSASGGGISNNLGASAYASLAKGSDGKPIVVWHDDSNGDSEIYVRRWDGSSWVEMSTGSASGGGISNNTEDSEYSAVAINSDGKPVVAWNDYSLGTGFAEIYVLKWE
jgi:hypothetical protein